MCHPLGRADASVSTPLSHWTRAGVGVGAAIQGALPSLETGIRSGLEVVPSARRLATYARRKVLGTPNGRPPPAPSARPAAGPLRAAAARPPLGRPARPGPRRQLQGQRLPRGQRHSRVAGWLCCRVEGWGALGRGTSGKAPGRLRGWSRSCHLAFAGDSCWSPPRPELVWTRPGGHPRGASMPGSGDR